MAIAVNDGRTEIFEDVAEIEEVDPGWLRFDNSDGITGDVIILIPNE